MEERINMMSPQLNEMQKRLFLVSEAIADRRGGITEVIRVIDVSRNTIKRGITDPLFKLDITKYNLHKSACYL